MELKLTINKDKTETTYRVETRTINYKVLKMIVDVFDVKNLLTALPEVLRSLENISGDKFKKSIENGEIEELVPLLNVIVNICLNSIDKVNDILIEVFKEYGLTEEDIDNADFNDVIDCVIKLITNVGTTLGLIKKAKK